MSTLQVEGIRNAAASSDAITLATDGTCTAKVTNNLSNRNLIINGAMQCAQYGTTDTSNGYFTTVDRWNCTVNGLEENVTRSQESLSTSDTGPYEKGFRNAWKFVNGNQTGGADADGYIIPQYAIEAQDLANSGWNYKSASSYITLSFWVKSSVAQTFYGFFRTIAGTDQAYSFSYALSANTWTKVTKTIPGLANGNIDINDDNTNGMSLFLPLFMGTDRTTSGHTLNTWAAYSSSSRTPDQTTTWYTTNDATWHLTGVQLEVDSTGSGVATDFEHRTYGDELARCQRYFYKTPYSGYYVGAGNGSTNMNHTQFTFPVAMRAQPSSMNAVNILVITSSNYTSASSKTPTIGQWCETGAALNWSGITGATDNRIGAIMLNGPNARVEFACDP